MEARLHMFERKLLRKMYGVIYDQEYQVWGRLCLEVSIKNDFIKAREENYENRDTGRR